MHDIIVQAYVKANEIIDGMLKPFDATELRTSLEKHSKKELIEMLVKHLTPASPKVTTEAISYAILGEPDCAWLTFETIAEIIKAKVPDAKTSKSCMSWYQTHATQKGKTVVPRKTKQEIVALVMTQ